MRGMIIAIAWLGDRDRMRPVSTDQLTSFLVRGLVCAFFYFYFYLFFSLLFSTCVDDWLSRSSVCPNCNVDVREAF